MTVISLRRRRSGGTKTKCDCLVTRYQATGGHRHPCVGFRFSLEMLSKLGWICGDYITVDFERSGSTGTWTITRVAGLAQDGIQLSKNNKAKTCTAKFTSEKSVIDMLFPHGVNVVESSLIQHDKNVAVFAFDWTS